MVYVHAGPTVALTPEAPAFRYADFSFDVARDRLIAVQEYHPNNSPSDVVNTLVAIPLTGTPALGNDGLVTHTTLASGCDFYSNPRVSPDGSRLACVVNMQGCPPAGCGTTFVDTITLLLIVYCPIQPDTCAGTTRTCRGTRLRWRWPRVRMPLTACTPCSARRALTAFVVSSGVYLRTVNEDGTYVCKLWVLTPRSHA